MLCPLCRARCEAGLTACPSCGVDFMKWLHLQGGKAARPRQRAAAVLGGRAAAWLLMLGAFAVFGWRARGSDAAGPRAPAFPAPVVVKAPSPPVLELARTEAEAYGVELPVGELLARYAQGQRAMLEGSFSAAAAELGIAPPRTVPLRGDEPAHYAKCLKAKAWSYGALPKHPEAGMSCWAAAPDLPRRWVHQHWQPRLKRWGDYPEADLARAWRRHIETAYSPENERVAREAVLRALAEPALDAARLRSALLGYYGWRAEREGALSMLERL